MIKEYVKAVSTIGYELGSHFVEYYEIHTVLCQTIVYNFHSLYLNFFPANSIQEEEEKCARVSGSEERRERGGKR